MAGFVIESPVWRLELEARSQDDLVRIVEDIADDARRACPLDSGDLMESIDTAHEPGVGYVTVGTDHWAPVEYGSEDHIIRPRARFLSRSGSTATYSGGHVLRFFWEKKGRWVFFRKVNHPGGPAQPFMRPSLMRRRLLPGGRR